MSDSLVKHIEALNAQTMAWVSESPETRFAGALVTDPDHWAEYDVYTPAEFERYQMEQVFSELHKQVYGVRPSSELMSEYTDEEFKIQLEDFHKQAEAEMEYQEINEELDQMDQEWSESQEAKENEFNGPWDDIAEDFDDVSTVKQTFC